MSLVALSIFGERNGGKTCFNYKNTQSLLWRKINKWAFCIFLLFVGYLWHFKIMFCCTDVCVHECSTEKKELVISKGWITSFPTEACHVVNVVLKVRRRILSSVADERRLCYLFSTEMALPGGQFYCCLAAFVQAGAVLAACTAEGDTASHW